MYQSQQSSSLSVSRCSKLDPKNQGERAMEGALHSLSQLDLGYIDLYLIHEPRTEGLEVTDQRNPGKEVRLSKINAPKYHWKHSCVHL